MDGRGRTLLPGLFDADVRVDPRPEAALRQLTAMGVTTALDVFSGAAPLAETVPLRHEGPAGLASVRTAGTGATAPGNMMEKLAGQPLPAVDGPAVAGDWVDARS